MWLNFPSKQPRNNDVYLQNCSVKSNVHVYTCVYKCTRIYIYTCMYMCVSVYMHVCKCIDAYVYIRT